MKNSKSEFMKMFEQMPERGRRNMALVVKIIFDEADADLERCRRKYGNGPELDRVLAEREFYERYYRVVH